MIFDNNTCKIIHEGDNAIYISIYVYIYIWIYTCIYIYTYGSVPLRYYKVACQSMQMLFSNRGLLWRVLVVVKRSSQISLPGSRQVCRGVPGANPGCGPGYRSAAKRWLFRSRVWTMLLAAATARSWRHGYRLLPVCSETMIHQEMLLSLQWQQHFAALDPPGPSRDP